MMAGKSLWSIISSAFVSCRHSLFCLRGWSLSVGASFVWSLAATCTAYAQGTWPSVALPNSVTVFGMGEQITANGLPMRVQGFLSQSKPAELLDWFRKSLGQPLVENAIAGKQILGRAQGGYYLSVQIESAGQGSKGLVAVTDLKTMVKHQRATQETTTQWLNRLPAGSKIVSQMSSEDSGNVNSQFVVVNNHDESLNRDTLIAIMREEGLELQRERTPDDKTLDRLPADLKSRKMLLFNGDGKEAIATIHRDDSGSTSVVFNIVTRIERRK